MAEPGRVKRFVGPEGDGIFDATIQLRSAVAWCQSLDKQVSKGFSKDRRGAGEAWIRAGYVACTSLQRLEGPNGGIGHTILGNLADGISTGGRQTDPLQWTAAGRSEFWSLGQYVPMTFPVPF